MLFDEDDASLLKKWIVKRLEDISDADSDVLADYVLALLRHDQGEDEVKQLCVDQLDDFLKEHTVQFVDDVFVALATKAFRSVNSTLAGGLSVHIPPPPRGDSPPGGDTIMSSPRDSRRAPKRSYYDRDEPERDDNDRYRSSYPRDRDRDRGSKMPRRGGGIPRGSWTGRGGFDGGSGRGAAAAPLGATVPPGQPPALFGVPPMPPVPWMPPNPNDPMSAFLAAQAAAAWGFHPPGAKLGDQKKIVKKVGERCKDYDEKGFCMKGDMCPYEHGVDPIVVSGQESKAEEYDPNNSMIFPPASTPERSTRGGRGTYRGRGSRSGSYGMRSNRAEFSITGPSFDRSNPRLVVENIPEDKLTESAIKDFFSTFGTIDKVEIHQHKHLAILTFTSWEMAKAAYDSPAPIFDNRFVKVFWFKSSEDTEAAPTAPQTVEEEKIDIEEIKRKQEELQKAYEQKMAKKKAHEEAVKELQKRQEELKRLQAEEKKKLMEKLAKKHAAAAAVTAASSPAASGSASPATSGTISAKQSDKAKVDATTVALKAQLEALQAEAEALGIDQNATEDSFDLDGFRGMGYRGRGRGRGRFPTRGYPPSYRGYSTYRGRGTWAPRGGAAPIPTLRLDNRTKRVAVTVPGGDKEEEIRHYLLNNGIELEAVDPHPEKENTRIFTFVDRRNAEKFVFAGNQIPDVGTVIMAWYNNPVSIKAPPPQETGGDTHMSEANSPPPQNIKMEEDSYDLAEDDEGRWLPE